MNNILDFFLLIIALSLILLGWIGHSIYSIKEPSDPTKVCKDGKLYEVTHEGNITIYDKLPFMTCEEK